MTNDVMNFYLASFWQLCRGEGVHLDNFMRRGDVRWWCFIWLVAISGSAAYGFGMGAANSVNMAWMVAIKFPLVITLTLMTNALLNGLLAQILGTGMGFMQCFRLLVLPFGLLGVMLLGLAPLNWFLAWHAPGPGSLSYPLWHAAFLLANTIAIAWTGVVAHKQSMSYAMKMSRHWQIGLLIFLIWLGGNLFVGGQVTWIFRPYFGSPGLPVQFLREHPTEGNFYEAVWRSVTHIFS